MELRKPFDVNQINDIEGEIRHMATESIKDIRRPLGVPARNESEHLIATREVTHGSFKENARISQSLKLILRSSHGWQSLTDVEREAMDMISVKFSRISSGRSLEKQHWEDVVGYGSLAEDECKKPE
jgi:ribosomal protein S10